eukprot:365192-Chlamydomonas_euryale.AAC.18
MITAGRRSVACADGEAIDRVETPLMVPARHSAARRRSLPSTPQAHNVKATGRMQAQGRMVAEEAEEVGPRSGSRRWLNPAAAPQQACIFVSEDVGGNCDQVRTRSYAARSGVDEQQLAACRLHGVHPLLLAPPSRIS